MVTPRNARQPTFFWQGLLILLPVGVLAVVGMISLRQDKILAEHDARERAQAIADGFLQKFSAELNSKGAPPNAAFSFAVDQAGDLAFPPAWNPLPIPRPLDPAVLNAEQARWWATLQAAETGAPDGEADDRAFKAFMDSNPPENFAAAAAYDQGLRLTQQGRLPEAVEAFALVTEKYPTATGESGLPLAPLAQLKLFEIQPQPQGPRYRVRHRVGARVNLLQPDGADTNLLSISLRHFVSLDMLCSNIVYHPTPLSSYLLNCVRGDQKSEKWLRRWQDHETARQMYAVARGHFVSRNQPVSEGFALMSISGNDQQDAEAEGAAAKVSFPRQFWFTTPNPLFLPKAQALGNGTGHSNYQGWSLVVGTNAPGTSNAVSTVTYWMGGGILDRNWLAITAGDAGSNRWYVCRGESELGLRIKELAEDEK
ncbi:MAG TPA: hypothetical protein VMB80_07390, partial [Candidatus Acidoferrum sp.]|nr:hypothetical protein [Candidatus Acidoferrum sp.]